MQINDVIRILVNPPRADYADEQIMWDIGIITPCKRRKGIATPTYQ